MHAMNTACYDITIHVSHVKTDFKPCSLQVHRTKNFGLHVKFTSIHNVILENKKITKNSQLETCLLVKRERDQMK